MLEAASEIRDLADVQRILHKNAEALKALSPDFSIELDFLSSGRAQEAIAKSFQQKMLQCLPSATEYVPIDSALAKVTVLMGGEDAEFMSPAIKDQVKVVRELLGKLLCDIAPDPSVMNANDFYRDVLNRFQFFLVTEGKDSKKGNTKRNTTIN